MLPTLVAWIAPGMYVGKQKTETEIGGRGLALPFPFQDYVQPEGKPER